MIDETNLGKIPTIWSGEIEFVGVGLEFGDVRSVC